MYQMTLHAMMRIRQRKLRPEWLLAALDGERVRQDDGTWIYADPATRCAVVIDHASGMLITALRLRPAKYKRIYSRR